MDSIVSPKITALVFSVLVICFGIAFYLFAWQEPSQTAPEGNMATPLNTGSVPQSKSGRVSATEFYDSQDSNYYLNPGGSSNLGGNLIVGGQIKITGGTPGPGKILCSINDSGLASWQTSASCAEYASSPPPQWTTCGDQITFNYKGSSVTYGTVSSLGKCWMDRNLGASQVATAYNDSAAYGDLLQWGRLDDGHQNRSSATTSVCSSSDNPGHNKFIPIVPNPFDWRCPQNNDLWQGVSGINNPCPSGWRIPTATEWDNERTSWSQQNYYGAFVSPLKLTAAGDRNCSYGWLDSVGSYGFYHSSSLKLEPWGSVGVFFLQLMDGLAQINEGARAYGGSVRCIKD